MASEIELWVTDRDGTKIAPLPEANVGNIVWELNKPGSAEFTIDPLSEGAREIEGIMREIQIWIDGDLMWWGVPWALNGKSQQISVKCEGLLSLFNKRYVDRSTLLYTSIDQFQIAWDLLAYAQSEAVEGNRDFNIGAISPMLPSGITRSREYERSEHKNILDAVLEFDRSELKNGFDFEIEIFPDGGRFFHPYFPRKGTLKGEWAVEWDSEGTRNIQDFDWGENFMPLVTLAYATGGSVTSGDVSFKKEGKYEDEPSSAYWGQMQGIFSEGTQMDEDWLDDRAEQIVLSNRDPEVTTQITQAIGFDSDALKELRVGDSIPVSVDHGRIQVNNWQRIGKITLDQANDLSLEFVEEVLV